MNIGDIRKRLQGPFIPFKIRTSDGREFIVPHREFVFITPPGHRVIVADKEGYVDILDPFHIVSLEEQGALPAA